MCSSTTTIVSPYLSGSFNKVSRARETTLLTRNEGTTDVSGKRFGCYQQDHSNLHRENSVSVSGGQYFEMDGVYSREARAVRPAWPIFTNYPPKAKLILLNNPRDEVEGIIQQY